MAKNNSNEQLNRMKALMNYGLQTEAKDTVFSSIEYQKEGADGKNYAIIREGKKYYIKEAPKKANLIKEDYNYIGGFRNRKDNEYDSFANAQKNFELKMMSIKEAKNAQDFKVETWDLNKKENVVLEASDKMKKEILRERQIMKNAKNIYENKMAECDGLGCIKPKDNIKSEKPKTGDAKDANDEYEDAELPKEMQTEEVLGWNRNADYMDKTHGTEIGDSAPFDDAKGKQITDNGEPTSETGEMKNGVVENHSTSMHDSDNQNTPSVGVGEGPSDDNNKPFDDEKGKQIDEAIDDLGDDLEDDAEMEDEVEADDAEADFAADDAEIAADDAEIADDDLADDEAAYELEDDDDVYEDDLESRVSAMEELLRAVAAKLGVEEGPVSDEPYEDDDLFDDEENDFTSDDEDFGYEDDDQAEDEYPMESRRYRHNGVEIYESASYRRAMGKGRINEEGMTPFTDKGRVPSGNMNKLDDFGKHPAYQKRVMSLPPKDMQEFPGYYDMNDDSVRNDEPYGEKIGDGAPFEVDPEKITNAIAESIKRVLKKK